MNSKYKEIMEELWPKEKTRTLGDGEFNEELKKNKVTSISLVDNNILKNGNQEKVAKMNYNHKILDRLSQLEPENNYPRDDNGLSKLFSDMYKDELRYNVTSRKWMFFDGKKWKEDLEGMYAASLAKELATHLYKYSLEISNQEKNKGYSEYVNKLGNFSKRETMIKDARDVNFMSNEDLDKDAFIFNCKNGTINLKTFEFKEHNPNDLLSKISNVVYDPQASSLLFEKFVNEIMIEDSDKINYLQKILGHSLTGHVMLETCFILYGATTRNGKSTLVETFAYMLGNNLGYSQNMRPETLALKKNLDSRQASGDIARLKGCRFLNASEPPKKMIFDVALLKTLLGRDTITAREIYQSDFEFVPVFKLFINTNFLPEVNNDTVFSSGRIKVISFDRHFKLEEQDLTLKDKFRKPENISGIFNWCIEGLKKFNETGAEPPKSVVEATNDYRNKSDKMSNFLSDCLESSSKNVKAKEVYDTYKKWCKVNDYGFENKSDFFEELRTKNLFSTRGTVDGKTCYNVIYNMRLKEKWLSSLDDEQHEQN